MLAMMFRIGPWLAGLCVFLAATAPTAAADLGKIDRTIHKEPAYSTKPRYGLLVFGPSAGTRVWVVQDGPTVYVDRNGDGDLTASDERFTLNSGNPKRKEFGSLHECKIEVRDPDGRTRYVITGIGIHPEGENSDGRHLMANVNIEGPVSYRQYCDAKLGASPDKASVAHFHGPLTAGPRTMNWKLTPELSRLPVGDPPGEIYNMVGTMDPEHGCWVVVRSEDLPKDLHPAVQVEFTPQNPGGAAFQKRYLLEQRC
jgi:hypothetical protein